MSSFVRAVSLDFDALPPKLAEYGVRQMAHLHFLAKSPRERRNAFLRSAGLNLLQAVLLAHAVSNILPPRPVAGTAPHAPPANLAALLAGTHPDLTHLIAPLEGLGVQDIDDLREFLAFEERDDLQEASGVTHMEMFMLEELMGRGATE